MNKSENFWDRTAGKYDQEEMKHSQTYIRTIEKTKKYLKMNDIVLDFGCGTGLISNEIAGNVKKVHAIDTSAKMIEIAIRKAEGRKIENIDYSHLPILNEKYERGSFDVILVFYLFHLLEDADQVMHRVNELLKPGGLIISATPCLGEKKVLLSTVLLLLSKIGLVPKIRSFKASELVDLIAGGNFEIVKTECLRQSTREYFIVAKKN